LGLPVVLVLVGTKAPGNLGAVCRLAKAFDLGEVRLVGGIADPGDAEAGWLARGAEDRLAAVRRFDTLRDALAGCWRSGATTARPRHWNRPVLLPGEAGGLSGATPERPYAVVFGPEDTGLTNELLAECDEILSVPLPGRTGATLSLPASCAIVGHELTRPARPAARGVRSTWGAAPLDESDLDILLDEVTGVLLDEIDLRPVPDAVRFRGTVRDFLARARPTRGDHRMLRYIFAGVGKWKRRVIGELRRSAS
jgi:TrmH family RNA methyltransferase